jgi:protocatechuate 3,4-dioxygenase, beta subunit
MTKRMRSCILTLLTTSLVACGSMGATSSPGGTIAQNQPRDLTDAPAQLGPSGRIAAAGEPGATLVISGSVVAQDGKTPLPGVMVYAYHTDADGYYRRVGQSGEAGENEPRLRGWVKTDSNGHFEFTTIKPAPYPSRDNPSHVHIHAWGAGYARQWFLLEFEGDPLLTKQHFTDNTAEYLYTVPVTRGSQGVLSCSVTIRMREQPNFPASQ